MSGHKQMSPHDLQYWKDQQVPCFSYCVVLGVELVTVIDGSPNFTLAGLASSGVALGVEPVTVLDGSPNFTTTYV